MAEEEATQVEDTGGVYFVPAFAGLGAPWWRSDVKATIQGMTLGTTKAHVLRAALESIAYQVKDLVDMMTRSAGIQLQELRVDGGPTRNRFLMQLQSDVLQSAVSISNLEEASSLGAVVMNGFARKKWTDFDQVAAMRQAKEPVRPQMPPEKVDALHQGWLAAVQHLLK